MSLNPKNMSYLYASIDNIVSFFQLRSWNIWCCLEVSDFTPISSSYWKKKWINWSACLNWCLVDWLIEASSEWQEAFLHLMFVKKRGGKGSRDPAESPNQHESPHLPSCGLKDTDGRLAGTHPKPRFVCVCVCVCKCGCQDVKRGRQKNSHFLSTVKNVLRSAWHQMFLERCWVTSCVVAILVFNHSHLSKWGSNRRCE